MYKQFSRGSQPAHRAFDFLLERLVHQMLRDDPRCGRDLLAVALAAGADPVWLLAEVLWPAAECLTQLRQDGLVTLRVFNHAARTLGILAAQLDGRMPAPRESGPRRRLLIVSATGEPTDLGAHLLTILAEAAGFTALFAGAGLNRSDVVFALTHLEPDALVIHGSLPESLKVTTELVEQLQAGRVWPQVQIATVGSMVGVQGKGEASGRQLGDLCSHHPLEILELLALCPDHRAMPVKQGADPLRMPAGTTPAPHGDSIHALMRAIFPPRPNFN